MIDSVRWHGELRVTRETMLCCGADTEKTGHGEYRSFVRVDHVSRDGNAFMVMPREPEFKEAVNATTKPKRPSGRLPLVPLGD